MSVRAIELREEASDEELVERYQHGDARSMDQLLERFRDFARLKARTYFIQGADRDDIVQEAMIGLYKSIRDYATGNNALFRTFAEVCITRQIITAVKTATRQKHGPLNSYVSLNTPLSSTDDPDRVLGDVIPAPPSADPAEALIHHEDTLAIKMAFAEVLSDFEAEVLHLYVEGKSYQDIAKRLHRSAKAIDNAIQRIKKKIEVNIRARDAEPEYLIRY